MKLLFLTISAVLLFTAQCSAEKTQEGSETPKLGKTEDTQKHEKNEKPANDDDAEETPFGLQFARGSNTDRFYTDDDESGEDSHGYGGGYPSSSEENEREVSGKRPGGKSAGRSTATQAGKTTGRTAGRSTGRTAGRTTGTSTGRTGGRTNGNSTFRSSMGFTQADLQTLTAPQLRQLLMEVLRREQTFRASGGVVPSNQRGRQNGQQTTRTTNTRRAANGRTTATGAQSKKVPVAG